MKINKKLSVLLAAVVLSMSSVFTPIAPTPSVEAASTYSAMQNSINSIMADSRMRASVSSVTVRKTNGEIVYQYYANRAVTPASSLKLLTASSALETLGENYRFQTNVLTNGTVSKGTLNGNLYLQGKGDPTLLKKDLDNFAAILKKRGVNTIAGHLVGDDTWFDTVRLSPGISKEDQSYYYGAQVSGLTLSPNTDYDAGSVIVEAKPTYNGRAAKIVLTPATSIVRIVNKSKTVPKGYKNTLKIKRNYGTNVIEITGNAPIGSSGKKEWISVSNPTAYALDVFKRSLAEKGIKLSSASKVVRGATPKDARVLLTKQSMPLKQLVVPFLKLSNNSHAEHLAKAMGREVYNDGSWDSGLQVMRDYATSIGLDITKWNFEDASGMSHANKVTSSELSMLLLQVRKEPWYGTLLKGLPVAGVNDRFVGGTLRYRMGGWPTKGNVIAKTGSLDNVSALAGYTQTADKETMIFTVLTQDYKTSTVPVIDKIASAITKSKK
ncbi:D-alanyl-D-alanine carboxypeptidase/D-alanyl-D-alanine-endopeptidase [Paenisporosarcina cavernae]|uniref:D-alanyl-D-alanine carboxypeptidase/D-alanyl-D-alanine-endopeptidase n=1 Tax=Paenisporosarcina cavernae TaxID=2320858 RepID=A0A385YPH8_9BACL|nr:D-alanyl-D-alanine carboxypeptidase/D-alanyl-D-alanine-endopeptidase [Paenisporosarcina cavernae]AYC28629.1 D-alanyl-D-alanine carboxypeptidase/D-alanyl-D-alanine-endopeptidase [Paenisporosarcina cavernae]